MKRLDNLFPAICDIRNLEQAERVAGRGKSRRKDVIAFREHLDDNLLAIQQALISKTYRTSAYTTFKVYEPKERIVFSLPYVDQVVHHAIMIQIGPMFYAMLTKDTYSCIKGRGIHKASYALRDALKDTGWTEYCLKIDIQKFYPSVNNDILKIMLRRKLKDADVLELLDEIIDSAIGLPIGNYLSIAFGNFYLAYFDHFVKEVLQVKYYFRYTDDMVILAGNKPYLHQLLAQIREYLWNELRLTLNRRYQVFPVDARGIDFVGYPTFSTHVLLRPDIKRAFCRMMAKRPNAASIASYKGWLKHANCLNLTKKILNEKVQRPKSAIEAVG